MSRTFKDRKRAILQKTSEKKRPLTAEHLKIKNQGFYGEFDYSVCPDCKTPCEYERGYFTCHNCGWGSFINENLYESGDLEFSRIA